VGVEKLRDRNVFVAASVAAAEFFLLTSAKGKTNVSRDDVVAIPL